MITTQQHGLIRHAVGGLKGSHYSGKRLPYLSENFTLQMVSTFSTPHKLLPPYAFINCNFYNLAKKFHFQGVYTLYNNHKCITNHLKFQAKLHTSLMCTTVCYTVCTYIILQRNTGTSSCLSILLKIKFFSLCDSYGVRKVKIMEVK